MAEYNGSGTLLRRYVHGTSVDDPVIWYEGSAIGPARWLHADNQGSVVAVTDSSANAIAINRYDEYGIPQNTNIGRFQYTGQAWIPELGMYYYKARIYSPTLGRFLQTDPIGYDDQVNLYAYVANDPVNRLDPTGTECVTIERQNCGKEKLAAAARSWKVPLRSTMLERGNRSKVVGAPRSNPSQALGQASRTVGLIGSAASAGHKAFEGGGSLGKALSSGGRAAGVTGAGLTLASELEKGKTAGDAAANTMGQVAAGVSAAVVAGGAALTFAGATPVVAALVGGAAAFGVDVAGIGQASGDFAEDFVRELRAADQTDLVQIHQDWRIP